tara:strand:+ start:71 stop:457 length:387 start_codon:yes stop_codon:yes gene_type:complete
MGSKLTKGVNFTAGGTVSHTDLANLVDDATIQAGAVTNTEVGATAITGQTEDTAPADNDYLLSYDTSGTGLKKVSRLALARGSAASPSSNSFAGTAGDIAYDSSYLYVCTATGAPGTWKRMALDLTSW